MRVAVIGAGRHARTSVWPSLSAAGVEVVAAVSRTESSARSSAQFHGTSHWFTDVRRMLDSVEIDGAVIVVPPAVYATAMRPCLEARVPVLCDKPGALGAGECDDLADLAERGDVPVVVGYQKRFAPSYRLARELSREPEFGPVVLGAFRWLMGSVGTLSRADWLLENAVHHLDLARWLCGDLVDVHVSVATPPGQHAVVVSGMTQKGGVVELRLGTVGSWWQNNESVELWGDGTTLLCDNLDTCTLRPPERPERVWRPNYTVPMATNTSGVVMGFVPTVEHFLAVATGAERSQSDLRSAAATLRLTERVVALADTAASQAGA